jgi:predicted  nucleic acid-binding Zn-ribbon protein
MQVDDTVQIRCSRCKTKFRDKARRVLQGYSRQCPSCECMIFFEEATPNKDVRQALLDAERVRRAVRAAEDEKVAAAAMTGRASEETDEEAAALPRRFDHRIRSRSRL